MKTLRFVKMQGSGNDFVVIRQKGVLPVEKICDRRFGVGADGVLRMGSSQKADVRMRIFNADGSEAEMCGNGARCLALYFSGVAQKKKFRIETNAGILDAVVDGTRVKLHMTDPTDLKLDVKVAVGNQIFDADFINTGVPHTVIEVDSLDGVPVQKLGRAIRRHDVFKPAGTNVNFVKIISEDRIRVRTYERGVEDETLACGTGSVASAIIAALNHAPEGFPKKTEKTSLARRISVETKSGEVLSVYLKVSKYKISDVWLEGEARIVFEGRYKFEA
jgi:diaminopimelate epimerase